MAYVDLNPIRASMANTPAQSDYTSMQERLGIAPEKHDNNKPVIEANPNTVELMAFAGSIKNDTPSNHLPFAFCDYLELVDWSLQRILAIATFVHPCTSTGRNSRNKKEEDKSGYIPADTPPILQQFNIDPQQWLANCTHIGRSYTSCIRDICAPCTSTKLLFSYRPCSQIRAVRESLTAEMAKRHRSLPSTLRPGVNPITPCKQYSC